MIALTFDLDHISDADLDRFLAELPIPGHATFFLHRPFSTPALGTHEIGLHPYLDSSEPWLTTVSNLRTAVPGDTRIIRPHSCVFSHLLAVNLAKQGFRAISQAAFPGRCDLAPYRHAWGLWELPIYYMDYMDIAMQSNWPGLSHEPFKTDIIRMSLDQDALFVYDFHPIHVILNTRTLDQYHSVRDHISSSTSLFDLAFAGNGTRSFYEQLCHAMTDRRVESLTCCDVLQARCPSCDRVQLSRDDHP